MVELLLPAWRTRCLPSAFKGTYRHVWWAYSALSGDFYGGAGDSLLVRESLLRNPNFGGKVRRKLKIMEEQIEVGDVVRFKSVGSPMTVEKIDGDEATCVFSLGGKQRLKLEVLKKAPDKPPW